MKLQLLSIYNYGEINLLINGKKYTYLLDSAFLPEFRRLMRRTPGKALNLLKKVSEEVEKC